MIFPCSSKSVSLSPLAFSFELLFLIYNLVYDPRFSTILIPAFLYVSASLNLSEICKIFSSSRDKSSRFLFISTIVVN